MHSHIDSVWLIHLNQAFTEKNAGQRERCYHPTAKKKLTFDDGTRQPLGRYEWLWVLMRLSVCFASVGKIWGLSTLWKCVKTGVVLCSGLIYIHINIWVGIFFAIIFAIVFRAGLNIIVFIALNCVIILQSYVAKLKIISNIIVMKIEQSQSENIPITIVIFQTDLSVKIE